MMNFLFVKYFNYHIPLIYKLNYLGLFNDVEKIKNIMYESFKEDTSSINQKIVKFLILSKNYFFSKIIIL